MARRPVRYGSVLRLEQLERRDAPATMVSPTRLTYQDSDGDNTIVTFSKSILNVGNVNTIFEFDTGSVNGSNTAKQQLRAIKLTNFAPTAAGVAITTSAVRSSVNGGDGFAALGQIDATGLDLGPIVIDGDLGRVLAGDATTKTTGLVALTAYSMGRYGLSTGASDLHTKIQGKLGAFTIKADVAETFIDVQGGADGDIGNITINGSLIGGTTTSAGRILAASDIGLVNIRGHVHGNAGTHSGQVHAVDGKISGVTIGGSLYGGAGGGSGRIWSDAGIGAVRVTGNIIGGNGPNSGQIFTTGALASIAIGGDLQGSAGDASGRVFSTGAMGMVRISGGVVGSSSSNSGEVATISTLTSVTIGRNLQGGSGDSSGRILSHGAMGLVTITGSVIGGSGLVSGTVFTNSSLAGATIGGDVQGGVGTESGRVFAVGAMGAVKINGNLFGGIGVDTGSVLTFGKMANVTIGGDVLGGPGIQSGRIVSVGAIGAVKINGDLIGGNAAIDANLMESGHIRAQEIATLTIGGSLVSGIDTTSGTFTDNGSIRVADSIGVAAFGNIFGNATNPVIVSARGKAVQTTTDVAIGSLTVRGSMEFGQILAGFDFLGAGVNADAQIGRVSVGSDWIASSLVAGAVATNGSFGDADDAKIVGGNAAIVSKIASLTIGGQVLGSGGESDHFGIVAENVVVVNIGGTPLRLNSGNSNDDLLVGITGDFRINEV